MSGMPQYSIVIPVYKNAGSIPELLERLASIDRSLGNELEVVFVVDGSPDDSFEILQNAADRLPFAFQLLLHSRNFGSFAAIRTGMRAALGRYMAVMAADMQEPPELVLEFFRVLALDEADVTVGTREGRDDPWLSRTLSGAFWRLYKRLVFSDMPAGGVDIFGCSRAVAQELLELDESHSSLVGLLYWVGYRRAEIPYSRAKRLHGKSGWTLKKKLRYLSDSVFSFTDLPLTLLTGFGVVGALATVLIGAAVLISFLAGAIHMPGYTPLMLVMLFSTFAILTACGIVGSYVWRAFENTKRRPFAIVRQHERSMTPVRVSS